MNFDQAKTILAANDLDVSVEIAKSGGLMQTVYGPSLDLEPYMRQRMQVLSQALAMVQETRVRNKLMDLGWVPPEEAGKLQHNIRVLTDALWKACGDDKAQVDAMIESQGVLLK